MVVAKEKKEWLWSAASKEPRENGESPIKNLAKLIGNRNQKITRVKRGGEIPPECTENIELRIPIIFMWVG